MNFADSEVVASILAKEGFSTTQNSAEADVILMKHLFPFAIKQNSAFEKRFDGI